jgi:hypothetical protein
MKFRALIAFALLALVGESARADFRTMVSPGPLANPHAQFDNQCDKCHVPFKGIPAANCLACHEHTKKEVEQNKGFHANMGDRKCSSCHGDHKGRDHKLSPPVDPAFNHATTGFVLDGRHATAKCGSCHVPGKSGETKWVGIATTCAGCHADTHHKGALGKNCTTCHSTSAWNKQTRTIADHKVPMTGGHQGLACATCHKDGSHFVEKASCGDCHTQKHGGTKAACATCHNTTAWKKATFTHDFCTCILPGKHQSTSCLNCHPAFKFNPTPMRCEGCHAKDAKHDNLGNCGQCHSALSWKTKTFDHNAKKVGFPIEGRHYEVACENCHTKPKVFKGAPTACEGCHKQPKHGNFGPCAKCHDTQDFTLPKFSHDTTRFPLDGAHKDVRCENCHSKFAKGTFKPGDSACALCHGDPHKGQFVPYAPAKHGEKLPAVTSVRYASGGPLPIPAVPPHPGNCKDCHTPAEWKPSTITVEAHQKFSFPLRGAHQKVDCMKCHDGGQFLGLPKECAQCHMDPHGGALGKDCEHCHGINKWQETPGFNHVALSGGVALTGAHAHLECSQCHGKDHKKLLGITNVTCATCHTPQHGQQFGGDCASCHKPTKFSDVAPFDHRAKTNFPLERRHAAVPCMVCHAPQKGDRLIPVCQGCHGDPHRGAMGTECSDCHRADRWQLVRFDHNRTEFPLRGRHFVVPCGDCHKNNVWTGLRTECVTCHAADRPSNATHAANGWSCGNSGCHSPFSWHAF